MGEYKFVTVRGRQFGIAIKPFRWFYLHGGSNRIAGGLRIGKLEVIW